MLARWLEGSGAKWYAAAAGQQRDGVGELHVAHAGLDVGDAVVQVDLEDAVHPRGRDDTPFSNATHPPASPVPEPRGTICTSRSASSFTIATTCSVFVGNTTARRARLGDREAVALVDEQPGRVGQDAAGRQDRSELGYQIGVDWGSGRNHLSIVVHVPGNVTRGSRHRCDRCNTLRRRGVP